MQVSEVLLLINKVFYFSISADIIYDIIIIILCFSISVVIIYGILNINIIFRFIILYIIIAIILCFNITLNDYVIIYTFIFFTSFINYFMVTLIWKYYYEMIQSIVKLTGACYIMIIQS